jgi:5-formyltetrahydrofolate cyclo-ligase
MIAAGVAKYGSPLSLDAKIKVDLIVVGSSAVDRNGARLGKGEVGDDLTHQLITHHCRERWVMTEFTS